MYYKELNKKLPVRLCFPPKKGEKEERKEGKKAGRQTEGGKKVCVIKLFFLRGKIYND